MGGGKVKGKVEMDRNENGFGVGVFRSHKQRGQKKNADQQFKWKKRAPRKKREFG